MPVSPLRQILPQQCGRPLLIRQKLDQLDSLRKALNNGNLIHSQAIMTLKASPTLGHAGYGQHHYYLHHPASVAPAQRSRDEIVSLSISDDEEQHQQEQDFNEHHHDDVINDIDDADITSVMNMTSISSGSNISNSSSAVMSSQKKKEEEPIESLLSDEDRAAELEGWEGGDDGNR